MQIQKNSRQVLKMKSYTSNKNFNDVLYAYLQTISYREDSASNNRYVNKSEVTMVKLAEKLGVSRPTVTKYFKELKSLGLIEEEKNLKRYRLNYLDRQLAFLLPASTLEKIIDSLSRHSISIYTYLLNRYLATDEKEFDFLIVQVKDFIGLSTDNRGNKIVTNVLEILQRLGLIQYTVRFEENKKKKIYRLIKATNELPNKM